MKTKADTTGSTGGSVGRAALGTMRRHPAATLRLGLFAARHWRLALTASELTRAVRDGIRDSREMRSARVVNAETRLALAELAQAADRARRLGLSNARGDRRVNRHLSRAASHALRAAATTANRPPPPRRKSIIRTTASGVGIALVGATAYMVWRVRFRSQEPEPPFD